MPFKFALSKTEKNLYYFSILIMLAAFLLLAWFLGGSLSANDDKLSIEPEKNVIQNKPGLSICKFESKLNGVCVDNSEETESKLIGVIVENHVDSWPLSGIDKASIVYEAPAEGNIPRLLAILPNTTKIQEIGPVRSARPYFVEIAKEYKGLMLLHVGGSPEALGMLQEEENLIDLNEFYRGGYFWRDKSRFAPHNVYTSEANWYKAFLQYDSSEKNAEFKKWFFSDQKNCLEDCLQEIKITFSKPTYEFTWKYNSSTAKYERFRNEIKVTTKEGFGLEADTLIVQKVNTKVTDAIGRLKIDTKSGGNVFIYRNGQKISGSWLQSEGRTIWVDQNGQEIPLQRGKIWIELLPTYSLVEEINKTY